MSPNGFTGMPWFVNPKCDKSTPFSLVFARHLIIGLAMQKNDVKKKVCEYWVGFECQKKVCEK